MKKKNSNNMSKVNKVDEVAILLKKIDDQKAYGIKLPQRKSDYDRWALLNDQILERNLISKKCHDKSAEEQLSRTLDDDTYKLFYKCLIEEKCRELFNIEPPFQNFN